MKIQLGICLGLILILRTRALRKAREGGPVRPGLGARPCLPRPGAARPHLQEARRLLLGLRGLQGRRLGGGEVGVEPHQQDRGRGAAGGGVHVWVWTRGLALWIPVW